MRLSTKQQYWLFTLAVVGFLTLAFAIGLIAFEYWWRGTPAYSVNQIGYAVKTHDLALFHRHVDTRSVANRLLDDLGAEAVRKEPSSALGRAVFEVFRPQFLESFESQVDRFVETGQFNDEKTTTQLGLRDLRDRFKSFGPILYTNIDGKSATVGLQVVEQKSNKTVILPLKMRQTTDGYWQLTEIDLTSIKPVE